MLALTLLVLLVASINYQLNLGYLLTFLLAGSAVVGMHVCHGTLRGLAMNLIAPEPQYAGASAAVRHQCCTTPGARAPRHRPGRAAAGTPDALGLDRRAGAGQHHGAGGLQAGAARPAPRAHADGRNPLSARHLPRLDGLAAGRAGAGLPRARSCIRRRCRPASRAPGGPAAARVQGGGEFDGVRAYRRGDPLKLVVWKKAAKADGRVRRTGEPRHAAGPAPRAVAGLRAGRARTTPKHGCRACAPGCCRPTGSACDYGLRLPGAEIKPGSGEAPQAALPGGAWRYVDQRPCSHALPRDAPRHPVPAGRHRLGHAAAGRPTCRWWCSALAAARAALARHAGRAGPARCRAAGGCSACWPWRSAPPG